VEEVIEDHLPLLEQTVHQLLDAELPPGPTN
jgi:hypothetical protein